MPIVMGCYHIDLLVILVSYLNYNDIFSMNLVEVKEKIITVFKT